MTNLLLSVVVFAPLAGALINWLVGRRVRDERFIGVVACGSVAVSAVVAFFIAFAGAGGAALTNDSATPVMSHLWTWIQVGSFRADFGFAMDRLSGIYACFVTFVGFLIHVFATGYMHGDRGFYRFFAYLNLFMFMMLTLVLADNFLLMFVGWEGVGLCSYLLIGYYIDRQEAGPTPVSALIHAATMVTAGVYLVVRCSAIYSHAPTALFIVAVIGAATAIFAATIGIAQNDIKKVLAYSTVSQLGYMFLACGVGAFVAAIFHVMTHAFFKALLFLGSGSVIHGMHHEQDMRRMGGLKKYMPVTFATMLAGWLAICGVPIFAGFFSKDEILWKTWSTQTAGTAGVGKFLWAGGAVTALLTAVYMTRLMVLTFWGGERFRETHAGGEADEAHAHAFDTGEKPHDAQLASAGDRPRHQPGETVGTHGHDAAADAHALEDEEEEEEHHHGPVEPHESPWTMTVPLVVLAVLSTLGGLVGVPYALSSLVGVKNDVNVFEHTLEPAVFHATEGAGGAANTAAAGRDVNSAAAERGAAAAERGAASSPVEPPGNAGASPRSVGEGRVGEAAGERTPDPAEISAERLFTLVSVAIALVGITVGWFWFQRRPLDEMPRLLENKYYVDEIYDAALIRPVKDVSREGLWKFFDVGVIDGIVNGLGRGMSELGAILRHMQPGFVRSYAAIILLGALAVVGYFAFNAFQLLSLK